MLVRKPQSKYLHCPSIRLNVTDKKKERKKPHTQLMFYSAVTCGLGGQYVISFFPTEKCFDREGGRIGGRGLFQPAWFAVNGGMVAFSPVEIMLCEI